MHAGQKSGGLERCSLVNRMENRFLIDVYNIYDKAIVKISIFTDREAETAESIAVHLTLVAEFVNADDNGFINVIIASFIEHFIQTFGGGVAKSAV
jgi:hypothetical protein